MAQNGGVIREVAWTELLPWLILVRALRLALRFRALVLSVAGVLLTIGGWALLAWIFSGTGDLQLQGWANWYQSSPWRAGGPPDLPPHSWQSVLGWRDSTFEPPDLGQQPTSPLHAGWWQLSAPFRALFFLAPSPTPFAGTLRLSWDGLAFMLLCALWVVAVWSLFGGALTRLAAVQLTRGEAIGSREALGYARGKWFSYFASPWMPLIGVLIITVPSAILGLLLRVDVGMLLVGIIWPLLLVGGLLMAIFLLGLIFGWPLMWGAISTEGTDSFDALSRSYSYVYQRPLHYLFYAVVAALLGILGAMLAYWFADAVIHLTLWAVSWGSGPERLSDVVLAGPGQLSEVGNAGAVLIRFWLGCVKLVALAFAYSYFWNASTAIYLLLRYHVDGTEMDEVYVADRPPESEPPEPSELPESSEPVAPAGSPEP